VWRIIENKVEDSYEIYAFGYPNALLATIEKK